MAFGVTDTVFVWSVQYEKLHLFSRLRSERDGDRGQRGREMKWRRREKRGRKMGGKERETG